MLPRLLQFVRAQQLIVPGDRLGVAVSGGADSVALLRALLESRDELGCVLSVVHLHHGLRGQHADADADFVRQLAEKFSLPLHLVRTDVAALAREQKLSLEAAGRQARVQLFAALRAEGHLDKVATAHTADDQSETVLLKLLRGAGTRGLAGVFPRAEHAGVALVRPLLSNTRAEVEHYLKTLQQPWREDETNRSPEFLRNRVRHELLPLLESDYNPAVRKALLSTAEVSREEQQFWDSTVAGVLDDIQSENGSIELSTFAAMHPALQRRLILALAAGSLEFDLVEKARAFLLAAQAGDCELSHGLRLRIARDPHAGHCFSFIHESAPGAPYHVELPLPGEAELSSRRTRLVARLSEATKFGAALDPSLAGRVLAIRNWQHGDRFQPTGRGEDTLKDFFQRMHVSAAARPSWPVALLDGKIVWVLGLPVAANFAAAGNRGIVIDELPLPHPDAAS